MNQLPIEVINKITLLNSHPVADLLKTEVKIVKNSMKLTMV